MGKSKPVLKDPLEEEACAIPVSLDPDVGSGEVPLDGCACTAVSSWATSDASSGQGPASPSALANRVRGLAALALLPEHMPRVTSGLHSLLISEL